MRRLITISIICFSFAAAAENKPIFHQPQSSPEELIKYVHDRIAIENIDINKYYLLDLAYNYITRKWSYRYEYDDPNIENGFVILISDTDPLNIKYYPAY